MPGMSPRPRQASDDDILKGAFRAIARLGPAKLTLADVAAEAGISMFQVQYYFPTKEQMLQYAWQRIAELSAERTGRGIAEALRTGDERAVVRACLLGVLPTDERSRMLCAVQIAYFAVDVTRGGQAPDQQAMFPHLVRLFADQLAQAQQRGGVPAHDCHGGGADGLAHRAARNDAAHGLGASGRGVPG